MGWQMGPFLVGVQANATKRGPFLVFVILFVYLPRGNLILFWRKVLQKRQLPSSWNRWKWDSSVVSP
uniref:Uncharacterized protein n=1 Tax=Anopheles atroparvus TaxID=41427 RepID=A0AAG5DMU4_ANOAO